MKITRNTQSRLLDINFNNLPFGTVFSDHMLVCHYVNGGWEDPEIKPYSAISLMPGTQVFHYGQAIFEGMKAFKNKDDEIILFRKEDNYKRFNRSAKRLSIPNIPKEVFMNGIDTLLQLDSDWLKNTNEHTLYIRPFIFASSECVKASSAEEFTFMIITCPTVNYYTKKIDMVVEEEYSRAAKGGVGYAKAAGNYAASFFPTKQANKQGFTQIIWTDAEEHKYIEESGTMNIWFRIDNQLITPKLTDTILGGITRESIIQLSKDLDIDVVEKKISISEIVTAFKQKKLQEAFGTGTAVSVAPLSSITFRGHKMELPNLEHPFSLRLKKELQDIQKGKKVDRHGWTTIVKSVTV